MFIAALVAGSTGAVGLAVDGAVAADPAVLVDEPFTGETADGGFLGYNDACLTGAPPVASFTLQDHPLVGCPAGLDAVSPPAGGAPFGFLQLTNNIDNRSGAVLYDSAIPATQGLDVSFEQWQYGGGGGGSEPYPADGIAFFLVDGSVTLDAPGAFGGSLGYAQKLDGPFFPGVTSGYLGVGLDVLGNFFNDREQRGAGCPTVSPGGTGVGLDASAVGQNMVTVRGPGTDTTGYCFITATYTGAPATPPGIGWASNLPGVLHGATPAGTPFPDGETAATALEPIKRTVRVVVTPAPDAVVTVFVDFNDGVGSRQVLEFAAPAGMPQSYKFGFSASTGLWNDVHLIRNVVVRSELPLPQLSLVKQVDGDQDLSGLVAGSTVGFEFLVSNTGTTEITGLTIEDDTIPGVGCPVTTLAPTDSTLCTGTYTITADDVAAGFVANVAVAHGTADGVTVDSDEGAATVPIDGDVGIILRKTVLDPDVVRVPGDIVHYVYDVFNDTTTPVSDVTILAPDVENLVCVPPELAPLGQVPLDRTVCTSTYTVTMEDALAGFIDRVAVARGISGGGPVLSQPASALVPAGLPPTTPPPTTPGPGPGPGPTDPGPNVTPPDPDVAGPTGAPIEGGPGQLPPTGADGGWFAAALLLLGVGALLLAGVRARRRA